MTESGVSSIITASFGCGVHQVSAELKVIGNDLIISIWGGTHPHIGSISVSVPRPGLSDKSKTGTTSSVINIIGHKDEIIARMFSEKIASALNTNTVATAGIHIEQISDDQINLITNNCSELCRIIIKRLEERNK